MLDKIIYYICIPLGYLMRWCWQLVGNYGLAIILFTLATKIVLLPVSVWIQKNSILMVKLMPEINRIKCRLFGNTDAIADEEAKLYKKEGYHPMLSLVPLAIQIILLMGVVYVIYNPFTYLFDISDAAILPLAEFIKANTEDNAFRLAIVNAIRSGSITSSTVISGVLPETLSNIVSNVQNFDVMFLGFDLTKVATETGGIYWLVPIIAGISSWFLCFTQNLANVIQHEQGKLSQIGLMVLSVGISLYLGCFVPAGIGLYWTASNLFSVLQMYILNAAINPKKYVDYAELEASRKELATLEELDKPEKKDADYRKNKAREKKDYKRFMSVTNKHLVVYSEKSGFYKYFGGIIEELLKNSNITIHYITNDPDDAIFTLAQSEPRIKPYYIGLKKCITLFMLLECDMMIMTTPDLNKFYFKRSSLKKDIEYVYIPHDMMSAHYTFREGAFDAFDTIFCAGEHIKDEMRATERAYGLKEKTLVSFGYPLSDSLREKGLEAQNKPKTTDLKRILIAPSWQFDNLLDSVIDDLIDGLYCDEYEITVRPHPEYVKRYGARLNGLVEKYKDKVGKNLRFELDFSSNTSIYESDIMITDWSGISVEFAFATHRPLIFINTEPKCENPNWEKTGLQPVDFTLRNEIGIALEKGEVREKIKPTAEKLLSCGNEYEGKINEWFDKLAYNHGTASVEGAKYILRSLSKKSKR